MYINRIGNVKVGGGLPDLLYSQTDQCARTAKKWNFLNLSNYLISKLSNYFVLKTNLSLSLNNDSFFYTHYKYGKE